MPSTLVLSMAAEQPKEEKPKWFHEGHGKDCDCDICFEVRGLLGE